MNQEEFGLVVRVVRESLGLVVVGCAWVCLVVAVLVGFDLIPARLL